MDPSSRVRSGRLLCVLIASSLLGSAFAAAPGRVDPGSRGASWKQYASSFGSGKAAPFSLPLKLDLTQAPVLAAFVQVMGATTLTPRQLEGLTPEAQAALVRESVAVYADVVLARVAPALSPGSPDSEALQVHQELTALRAIANALPEPHREQVSASHEVLQAQVEQIRENAAKKTVEEGTLDWQKKTTQNVPESAREEAGRFGALKDRFVALTKWTGRGDKPEVKTPPPPSETALTPDSWGDKLLAKLARSKLPGAAGAAQKLIAKYRAEPARALAVLAGRDEALSALAASALSGQSLPEPLQARLRGVLSSPLGHARRNAAGVLKSQPVHSEADKLAAAEALSDAEAGETAFEILGGEMSEPVLLALARRLGEARAAQAKKIAMTLKFRDIPDSVVAVLARELGDADRDRQARALDAMSKTPAPGEAQLVVMAKALAHPNGEVRYAAWEFMKNRKSLPPAALRVLLDHLSGPSETAADYAATLLAGQANLPVSVHQALLGLLRTDDVAVVTRLGALLARLESVPYQYRREIARLLESEPDGPRRDLLRGLLEKAAIKVPVAEGRDVFEAYGYELPYAVPGLETRKAERRASFALVRPGAAAPKELTAAFERFQALINANFIALQMIANSKAMTRATAEKILAETGRMVAALRRLDREGAADLSAAFAALSRELKASWKPLGARENLSVETSDRVSGGETSSLQTLINKLHQKSFRSWEKVTRSVKADGLVSGEGPSFSVMNLSPSPLIDKATVLSPALRLLLKSVVPKNGTAILRGDEAWFHSQIGKHSVAVDLHLAGPDDGGLLRIRYMESEADDEGNRLRLIYLTRAFELLGIPAQVEGKKFLSVSWDKDHGLRSKADLERAVPFVLRALAQTPYVDRALFTISKTFGVAKAEELVEAMAQSLVAEGAIPFYKEIHAEWVDDTLVFDREQLYRDFLAWRKKAPERDRVRAALDAELSRLGLPPLPAGLLGQKVLDGHFAQAILLAVGRGELAYDAAGLPQKAKVRQLDDLAGMIVADEEHAVGLAAALSALGAEEARLETVGTVGRFTVERAQWTTRGAEVVTLHVLRDPETGTFAYAVADRFDGKDMRQLEPDELPALLRAHGLSAGTGELPGPLVRARWRRLLSSAPRPKTLRAELKGIAASGGDGSFVTARLTFEKKGFVAGRVFVAAYTTPDDYEIMKRAGAIVTTGGGLLSHATISARELRKPAVILPAAVLVKGGDGTTRLALATVEYAGSVQARGGVWISRRTSAREHVLREGDLVRVDGQTGVVTPIASAPGVVDAFDLLEALKRGAANPLEVSSWLERQGAEVQYEAALFILGEALWNRSLAGFRDELLRAISESVRGEPRARLLETGAEVLSAELARLEQDVSDEPAPDEGALTRFAARAHDLQALARMISAPMGRIEAQQARLAELWISAQDRKAAEKAAAMDAVLALAARVDSLTAADLPAVRRALRKAWPTRRPGEKRDLAFVCTGNACRSPIAEYQMKALLQQAGEKGIEVFSRGLAPGSVGITSEAIAVLGKAGTDASAHQQRPLTSEDIARADLLLAMTHKHVQNLIAEHPEALPKTFLLKAYARQGSSDVHDPVGLDMAAYRVAASEINAALAMILEQERALVALARKEDELAAKKRAALAKLKPSILPLGGLDDDFALLFGGKSAKLGEIIPVVRRAGGGVPPGFGLSTEAYLRFLEETALKAVLAKELAAIDAFLAGGGLDRPDGAAALARHSAAIRALLLSGKLNPREGLGKEVLAALSDDLMAVRSSAVQEDLSGAAFAGAAESHLNVSADQILEKNVDTWASFWLPRGIEYRFKQGIRSVDLKPAETVQKMVDARVSGVIFTVNPVTGKRDMVINAAYGLGEGVVSGLVQPDQYTADYSGQETLPALLGNKAIKIVYKPGGGTLAVPVLPSLRRQSSLTSDEVSRLVRIAAALTEHFGYPLDIEFAIDEDDAIWILQARAVTTK